jgi:hypothetical protein
MIPKASLSRAEEPAMDGVLSHIDPVHILAYDSFKIHFNIILSCTGTFPSGLFLSGFPTE